MLWEGDKCVMRWRRRHGVMFVVFNAPATVVIYICEVALSRQVGVPMCMLNGA